MFVMFRLDLVPADEYEDKCFRNLEENTPLIKEDKVIIQRRNKTIRKEIGNSSRVE